MSANHGKIHWSELVTDDPKGAADWYAKTLGWKISEMDMGGGEPYRIATAAGDGEGHAQAGIMKRPEGMPADVPPHWLTYIAVDDVDATIKSAPQVITQPFDVPNIGRISVIVDAGGAFVGLITPASQG